MAALRLAMPPKRFIHHLMRNGALGITFRPPAHTRGAPRRCDANGIGIPDRVTVTSANGPQPHEMYGRVRSGTDSSRARPVSRVRALRGIPSATLRPARSRRLVLPESIGAHGAPGRLARLEDSSRKIRTSSRETTTRSTGSGSQLLRHPGSPQNPIKDSRESNSFSSRIQRNK